MNDDELKQQLNTSMQDVIEGIDDVTQNKLNQARHQAVNQIHERGFKWQRWSLASGGTLAAIAVLAMVLVNTTPDSPIQAETYAVLEDIDLLANDSDPEFYQELEFLDWLDQNNLLDNDI